MESPSQKLRALMERDGPVHIAGAHNALSALVCERAGFDGIWGSGFEIATAQGVPDANIIAWPEHLAVLRTMVSRIGIPILADCDSGFGDATTVMRIVQEYERAGAGGMVLEDNVFPKRNSFYQDVRFNMVPVEEHVGKIRAAKAAQRSPDFFIAARTETLSLGLGVAEALRRAEAYHEAGADAVLIHAKTHSPDELFEVGKEWAGRSPLICVPTKFGHVTARELFEGGYKVVIYANMAVRAALAGMVNVMTRLREAEMIDAVEDEMASLSQVFEYVGVDELASREKEFIPGPKEPA